MLNGGFTLGNTLAINWDPAGERAKSTIMALRPLGNWDEELKFGDTKYDQPFRQLTHPANHLAQGGLSALF